MVSLRVAREFHSDDEQPPRPPLKSGNCGHVGWVKQSVKCFIISCNRRMRLKLKLFCIIDK